MALPPVGFDTGLTMPSCELIRKGDDDARWSVKWNKETLCLIGPEEEVLVELPTSDAMELFDTFDLFVKQRVTIGTPFEKLEFAADDAGLRALQGLVDDGYRQHPEIRQRAMRHSLLMVMIGVTMFVVSGGLFALYCWWASWAPDPPPGHWLRWVAPLISLGLTVLLAAAIGGPPLAWRGMRLCFLYRRFA